MSTTIASVPRGADDALSAIRPSRWARTPKGLLTLVFVPLLLAAGTAQGWDRALPHLAAAVAGAYLADLLATWLEGLPWRWSTSPLLTGLIVGFVLAPDEWWAVTLAVGAIATASKHLFRTRRGHIFNPAALGLLVSIPLFGTGQSWWGALAELPWPWLILLLLAGVVVVDRVNKFPAVLSFLGTYFALFTFAAMANPAGVAEMFRAPFVQAALFLAFFMLTDPPTSPGSYLEQVWIGALVAAVSCVAQLAGVGQAYLLVGILAGNAALVGWRWARDGRVRQRASISAAGGA